MSATVITFPSAPSGPSQFTPEARGALIALAASRPRWNISLAACDDGDEWAAYSDTLSNSDASFMVAALPGGRLKVWEGWTNDIGTFATAADAVAALREAGV